MNILKRAIAGLALVFAAYAPQANADLSLNYLFQTNQYVSPLLTASFTNITGGVALTITTTGVLASEWVKGFYLNVSPTLNPTSLTVTHDTGATAESVGKGVNAFKADGDGYYDLKLTFQNAGSANADPARFYGQNTTSVYEITGIGLSASSFLFTSSPVDGSGHGSSSYAPLFAAAQTSGAWVAAVPEPETYAMMIAGLALMGWMARRRRQSLHPEPV